MKAVIQRVKHSSVTVDGELISKINNGFMILLGVMDGDTEEDANKLVKKIPNLSLSNFRSLSGDLITFDNDSVLGVGKYLIVMKNNENVIPIFSDGNQHRLITLSNDPNLNRYYSVDQISKYVKI